MLKWFRKYNKILLAVFASVLMVVFLLPQGMNWFQGNRTDYAVYTLKDGSEITFGDTDRAGAVLSVLGGLSSVLLFQPSGDQPFQTPEPAHWALMLHEAHEMGIHGSALEVDKVLAALGLGEEGQLAERAALIRQSPDAVREALRDWVTIQHYREVMLGLAHLTIDERLAQIASAMQFLQFYQQFDPSNPMLPVLMRSTLEPVAGRPRTSAPLLEQIITEANSRVTIAGLLVRTDRYLDEVPMPSAQDIQALYEKYRDQPAGAESTSPHGFGYRIPDRVKVEYLSFDADRVRQMIEIDDIDAVTYYDEHPQEFQTPGQGEGAEPVTQPYADVEQRIKDQLADAEVAKKMRAMVDMAYNALLEDMQGLTLEDNYRVLGEDFTPTPMPAIADRVERAFGLGPDYVRIDDRWLTADDLDSLAGIGSVQGFSQYALSAVEIYGRHADDKQKQMRPQVGLTSQPVGDPDGNIYLFRLIDAQASHAPESINEVRGYVERDTLRGAAYEKLLAERPTWSQRFSTAEDLDALAEEYGVDRIGGTKGTATFPRREAGTRVPDVEGIGVDEAFVDAVYEWVDRLRDEGNIADLPSLKRRALIPVDRQLSLAMVEVRSFSGMTREAYRQALQNPQEQQMTALRVAGALSDTQVARVDPLSFDAVVARLVKPEKKKGASNDQSKDTSADE